MPPDWATLVTADGAHFAVPLAAGGFPQLLRDLPALLRAERRSSLLAEGSPVSVPALVRWADDAAEKVRLPQALVGAGALRLARQFNAAEIVLNRLRLNIPEKWRLAMLNEDAALVGACG